MHLIACPACHRQFDVSHLAPGSRIRCLCNDLLDVGNMQPLPVEGLRCTHCGGAVGPDDQACGYCLAALDDKDRRKSTLCPECMHRLESDSQHCNHCGVPINPQALTALPADSKCPRCKEQLRNRDLGPSDVIECSKCYGVWVTPSIFERLCKMAEDESNSLFSEMSSGVVTPDIRDQPVAYIPCLSCGEFMLRKQFRHRDRPTGVIVDYCRSHGVWLDCDELERIFAAIVNIAHTSSAAAAAGLFEAPTKRARETRPSGFEGPGWSHEKGGFLAATLRALGRMISPY